MGKNLAHKVNHKFELFFHHFHIYKFVNIRLMADKNKIQQDLISCPPLPNPYFYVVLIGKDQKNEDEESNGGWNLVS